MNLSEIGNMPNILQVEQFLHNHENKLELPSTHYQIDGVYVRSLFIPAGTMLTGKIHNFENIAILAQGTIKIADSDKSYEISAPYIMVDKPGVKRLGYAVTDVTFITVHRTDKKEIDEIEEELVSKDFEEFEQKRLLQGGNTCRLQQSQQQ